MSNYYNHPLDCINCCRAGINSEKKEMTFAIYYETKDYDGNDTFEILYKDIKGDDEKDIIDRLEPNIKYDTPSAIISKIFRIEKSYDNEHFIPFWEKQAKNEQLNLFN